MSLFKLKSNFKPAKPQADAIDKLVKGYNVFDKQTLLGITGSGKTFIIANIIENIGKPTLILAHNKTLAAQLYQEIKDFFPDNHVEYFISYYDYYQPESYLPTSDTYIEKEATINEQIEKMRLKTLANLLTHEDVIVVASISCIYGAGDPKDYKELSYKVKVGETIQRNFFLNKLVNMLYTRDDNIFENGKFRVRGDTIDVYLSYDEIIIRVEMFGDEIEAIYEIDPLTNEKIKEYQEYIFAPAKQFAVTEDTMQNAILKIKEELKNHAGTLNLLEEQRIKQRVKYDIEMMEEMGYCTGIENYSRHFENREPGTPPKVLLDYFPEDFLLVIDESHQTIPQAHGMYKGDYQRKKNLIDFGFRLPSAYDNRPLKFEEFEKYFNHTIFVSATPAEYEIEKSGQVVEVIIRPTGLLDPEVEIRPIDGQIKDLLNEIKKVVKTNQRVLVTTLTKKMAEDITNYFAKEQIKVRYLHSDIDSLDRIELIRDLRAGEFDVLVGINLLREGLDIPEVSLVAILDADKEGFLRNEKSLIQTIGRAARNQNGKVIMYADKITKSIKIAVEKTAFRRKKQIQYNKKNNITPKTIIKNINDKTREIKGTKHLAKEDIEKKIISLESDMKKAAQELDFEKAIKLREMIKQLKENE